MAILNYTTQIDCHKTIGEIQKILAKKYANGFLINYADGEPDSLIFTMPVRDQTISFRLPSNWRKVLTVINRDKTIPVKLKTNEQAKRVAWRIVKDWIEAQMALIEAELVEPFEIFLPYSVMKNGQTLFENFVDNPSRLLTQ